MLRDRTAQAVRRFLGDEDFIEIETPILTKSTPEGARDFLVPSRLQPGEFYALPQSPQLFKQLLMVAGYERYYQLARAFRDEDLRADRQLEHTQIDVEMSFVEEDDIMDVVERMVVSIFGTALGVELPQPFPRLTYAESMLRFGSDKPDVRFGMEIVDVGPLVRDVEFKVFADALAAGGAVRGLRAEGAAGFSRKDVDDLTKEAAVFGAKGVAPIWVEETGLRSPIAKFFTEGQLAAVVERMGGRPGDLLLFVADRTAVVEASLGALRLSLADRLGVAREGWRVPLDRRPAHVRVRRARAAAQGAAPSVHQAPAVVARRTARTAAGVGHLRVRPRAERRGTRQRLGPDRRPGACRRRSSRRWA